MTLPKDAPRCPAKNRSGQQCGHPAGYGTEHTGSGLCKFHGGSAPGGIKQAQRQQAAASASAFGLPVDIGPDEALTQELARCAGEVSFLARHLQTVDPDARLVGASAAFAERFDQQRDRMTKVAKAMLDAGIAERQVAAIERSADAFAGVLRAVLGELGVLDDPRAPAVVQRHLALLDAGPAVGAA